MGIFFGCNVYKCVQMCTAKAIFFRPSGSDNPPSTAKAALQASGRRVSIVVVQISFRDGKLPPWQMPRALDAERHAISQELPSHSRLPVCRPCDSALACRQYRLWCAWSASFGKPSPWQCLVHSMQSPVPSVRTSLPSRALLCADRVTRPLCDDGIGSRVPMYRPLCADRVRFPRHVNRASYHPTQTTRRLVPVGCFARPLGTAAAPLGCRQSRLAYADRVRLPRH